MLLPKLIFLRIAISLQVFPTISLLFLWPFLHLDSVALPFISQEKLNLFCGQSFTDMLLELLSFQFLPWLLIVKLLMPVIYFYGTFIGGLSFLIFSNQL